MRSPDERSEIRVLGTRHHELEIDPGSALLHPGYVAVLT
jgi:hypothetical protein